MQPDSIKQLRATQVLGKKVKSPLSLFAVSRFELRPNPLSIYLSIYRAGRLCWDITTTAYAKHFVKLFLKPLCHLLHLQSHHEQQQYLLLEMKKK